LFEKRGLLAKVAIRQRKRASEVAA